MTTVRIALAQINPTVGDFNGNAQKIIAAIERARASGADIVAVPELALPGYPPEDLLLKPQFIHANLKTLDQVIAASKGIISIVGFVDRTADIHNAAAVICDGRLKGVYHKTFLPNYSVFDEFRYFDAGQSAPVYKYGDVSFGVNICEDIWYPGGPTQVQALAGAQIIINISASPYHAGKGRDRERMLATRAEDNAVALAYVNLVGGQDELVFDGQSLIINERGQTIARGKLFEEDLIIADINAERVFKERLHDPRRRQERIDLASEGMAVERIVLRDAPFPGAQASPHAAVVRESTKNYSITDPAPHKGMQALPCEVYQALVTGTRDYVWKNGFKSVVIGLSGGVDSALVASVAADALAAENVTCVFMPTRFSSDESARDAERLARNLGVAYHVVPIEETFKQYLEMLKPVFAGTPMGIAEENIQARVRGNILMAFSNKFNSLVLSTGNKSEMSVGYCTLYGDMCGGFAVIKDVPKTLVYEICEYLNRRGTQALIPEYILTRAPSAELRENQKDTDSLPPYDTLDAILEMYVEEDLSIDAIIAEGFDEKTVRWVIRQVDINEYKRRQAAPGVRITPRAFGRDRRMPITNKFHG